MNKLLLLILLIAICSPLIGQSIDFSMGQTTLGPYSTNIRIAFPIEVKQTLLIEPYGGWKTWADWNKPYPFGGSPFQDVYDMGLKLTLYKTVYFDLNHYCIHDVVHRTKTDGSVDPDPRWRGKKEDPKNWDKQLTTYTLGFKYTFNVLEIK